LKNAILSSTTNKFKKYYKYYDPSLNFDRSKVKGLLAHLVNIKQSDRHAIALEVTGLYILFPSRHSFFLLPF